MASDVWIQCKGDGPKVDVPSPVTCCSRPLKTRADAIQVEELNRIAVISWINRTSPGVRALSSPGGISIISGKERSSRVALVGDWVVRTRDGEVFVIQKTLFASLFIITATKTRRKK